MKENCPVRPKNIREFIKSSWFLKPLQSVVVGSILGIILYSISGNSPYTNNIYGDIMAGIVIGLFFISIPCLTCNSEQEL